MKKSPSFNSDRFNPVLIKEVRQFFHNKFFLSLAGILLGGQLLLIFIYNLSFEDWKKGDLAGTTFIVIDSVFMYLCVFLTAACSAMLRFTDERASKELDFCNITLLTPMQIVGGKLASSLVIWLLIAALCLPFMTVAYFFRNITPMQIILIFAAGILPMLVTIQAALFCGALGKKWAHAVFVLFCCQVIPLMVAVAVSTVFERKARLDIFWLVQGGEAIMFLLLFAATTALITPPFANRMFVLRLLLVITLIPVWAVIPCLNTFNLEVQMVLCCFPIGIFSMLALLNSCDRDTPGARVLAGVPKNLTGRVWHYLLSSNRTGGVVLGLILLAVSLGEMLIMSSREDQSHIMFSLGVGGYALFYSEIAILLHRRFPQLPGWGWLTVVFLLLGVVTITAAFDPAIKAVDIYTSVFSLLGIEGMPKIMDHHFWVAPCGALLAGIPFIVEMFRNFKDYRTPEIKRQ